MGELYDADPVAEVLAHFKQDPLVIDAAGGEDHISGMIEGPWPHVVVSPGAGGDLREAVASMEPDVLVEVIGPADGTIGPAALWRIAMKAVVSAKGMPERDHVAGRAVVSAVRFTGGLTKQPLSSGQIRWSATLSVTISAPQG